MNELNCDVIKDLIPLYIDEVASDASKEIVENHVENCKTCQVYLQELKKKIKLPSNQNVRMIDAEKMKGFRKWIRNGKIRAVIIVVAIIIALLMAYFIPRNVKLKQNENNIVSTWSDKSGDIITFNENGSMIINHDLDATGITSGDAVYYFSLTPDYIRVIQGDNSAEFQVKIKDNQLTLYFAGKEYLQLKK